MATWRVSSALWKQTWPRATSTSSGRITPNKEPQGLRFAIHDVEAWGWDNIRWAMNRAGSATTACCGSPIRPLSVPRPWRPTTLSPRR